MEYAAQILETWHC